MPRRHCGHSCGGHILLALSGRNGNHGYVAFHDFGQVDRGQDVVRKGRACEAGMQDSASSADNYCGKMQDEASWQKQRLVILKQLLPMRFIHTEGHGNCKYNVGRVMPPVLGSKDDEDVSLIRVGLKIQTAHYLMIIRTGMMVVWQHCKLLSAYAENLERDAGGLRIVCHGLAECVAWWAMYIGQ